MSRNSPDPLDASIAPDASTFGPGLALLPPAIRREVYRLYGVLRTLDDLVDEDLPEALERVEAVERWAAGKALDTPETRTLAELCRSTALSPAPLVTFCEGMRHDIARTPIETEADLETYSERAGGAVGIMFAQILGTPDRAYEKTMATLGRAVQRTNILRDIDEDAEHRRLYISRSTIERFGAPVAGAREELMRDQIARADRLYEEALETLPALWQTLQVPAETQRAIILGTVLYREILRQIEREGYGRRPGRVTIPPSRQRILIDGLHLPSR
jgi:phytoene synthase